MYSNSRLQYQQWDVQYLTQKQAQGVGTLNPVFIDDVIRDRNLGYLERLCAVCEQIKVNPIWYDKESVQNKLKMLKVYQLSTQYTSNVDRIYDNASNQISKKLQDKKKTVKSLKEDVRAHKAETDLLKKKYKKDRLLLEKKIVKNYEMKMMKMRDQLVNQKALRNQSEESSSRLDEDLSEIHPSPSQPQIIYVPYPPPPQYLPNGGMAPNQYPQYNPYYGNNYPPPQYPPQHNPHLIAPGQLNHPPNHPPYNLESFNKNGESSSPKHQQHFKPTNQNKYPRTVTNQAESRKNTQSGKSKEQSGFSLTESNYVKKEKGNDSQILEGGAQFDKNTGRFNSGSQRSSNIITSRTQNIMGSIHDSQTKDAVTQLTELNKKNKKMSRKQSLTDSAIQGFDSIMDIHLKQQSSKQTNLKSQLNNKKDAKKTSIMKPKISDQYSLHNSNQGREPVEKKFAGDDLELIERQKQAKNLKDSTISAKTVKTQDNYLAQSNNGTKKAQKGFGGNLILRDSAKRSEMADSMEDEESPRKSYIGTVKQTVPEQEQHYEDDFEDSNNTPIVITVRQSIEKPKKVLKYVPLYKGIFVQKGTMLTTTNSQHLKQSSFDSLIGSLRQLTVRNSGAGNKKNRPTSNLNSRLSDFDCELDMIEMPENSRIARPSYQKVSTIRKTAVIQKITNSEDITIKEETQTQKVIETNIKDGGNFLKPTVFKTIQQQRTKITKSESNPKMNNKDLHHEKLSQIELAESHIYSHIEGEQEKQKQKVEEKQQIEEKQQSIISIIDDPLQQQQIQQAKLKKQKKQKIRQLIKDKYHAEIIGNASAHFDTMILKNQIKTKVKDTGQLGWEDIIDLYQQQNKKLRKEIMKKKQEDKIRRSQIIDDEKIKITHSKIERQQSNKQLGKSDLNDLTYSTSMVENKITPQTSKDIISLSNLSSDVQKPKNFLDLGRQEVIRSKIPDVIQEVDEDANRASLRDKQKPQIPKKDEPPKYALEIKKSNNIAKLERQTKMQSKFNLDDEPQRAIIRRAQQKKEEEDDDF